MIRPEHLVVLIGSNPLPNYIAVRALQPQRVTLLHTTETAAVKDRLRTALAAEVPDMWMDAVPTDGFRAERIRDSCTRLPYVTHLNYTGGTKPMAAHALDALGLAPENCSYVDERDQVLRFDDGRSEKLGRLDIKLTLDLLLRLHDCTAPPSVTVTGAPQLSDAEAIRDVVLTDPRNAAQFYSEGKRLESLGLTKAKDQPFIPSDFHGGLTQTGIPGSGWTARQLKAWCDFMGGNWLELCVEDWVKTAVEGDYTDMQQGVNVTNREGRCFQVDVACVRGCRLHLMSVTTDDSLSLCKSKLFEVALRARQMGGDLARACIVCLLHRTSEKEGKHIDLLRADVASAWDDPVKPEAFGLEDLKTWAGVEVEQSLDSLRDWLNS